MPLNYYFADNFFKKMTDLDSPRRNNDCYFYYYSTCTKGDSCTFRHEPSALGCETMCSFWKEGKCLNVHCNYRHMELRKNRKAIQCYWETQPGGCLKQHCPFLHQSVRQSMTNYDDNTTTNANNTNDTENAESTEEVSLSPTQNEIGGQASERNFRNQVDSLVVNFEEESDTESLPRQSPSKPKVKKVRVKTLEEIRLDRIQEESAAYFAYSLDHPDNDKGEDLRRNLMRKRKNVEQENFRYLAKKSKSDFATNAQSDMHQPYFSPNSGMFSKINKNGLQNFNPEEIGSSKIENMRENNSLLNLLGIKNRGIKKITQRSRKDVASIKIKTLEEIRAEKMRRKAEMDSKVGSTELVEEISSTTKELEEDKKSTESLTVKGTSEKKKLKLQRLPSTELQTLLSENEKTQVGKQLEMANAEESLKQRPVQLTVDNTGDTIENFAIQPDSVVSSPQSVPPQKLSSDKEDITVDSTKYEDEMLMIDDDLDFEDDGLMNEIDSILSK